MKQQSASQSPNASALEAWYQDYLAEDPDSIGPDSDVVREVEADDLDDTEIEQQIQRLLPTTDVDSELGFCVKCRHVLDNWPDLTFKEWACAVARTLDTCEVEAAARSGCKFCAFLLMRFKVEWQLDTFRKIERRLRLVNSNGTASLMIQRPGGPTRFPWCLWVNYPLKVTPHIDNFAAAQVVRFETNIVPPTAGHLWEEDLDPLELAARWLDTCQSTHEHCRTAKQQRHERPSRLIAIDHNTGKVKLVSTASMETLPPYASLSYRWGTASFTLLTTANYDAFHSSIPLDLLPQTFQDAIRITAKFNISHIWIDALCIVQHEPGNVDWLREAGRMRSVYGSATVNLAASWAQDVHQSLFTRNQKEPQARNRGGFCARVTHPYMSATALLQTFHSHTVYKESVTDTPLARRGWALQEKLLAPRTLHLGSNDSPAGLFWECRSSVASESLPDGFPGVPVRQRYLVCENGVGQGGWDWWQIVRKYTATSLTMPGDKLTALAGIARAQALATATPGEKMEHHQQYLAGMWREKFIVQLGWSVEASEGRRPRPREWRAPSWSWAAVDGLIWFWPLGNKELVGKMRKFLRVIHVWTKPAGPDPFGAISKGGLTVACEGMVCGWLVADSESHEDGIGDGGAVIVGETEAFQSVHVYSRGSGWQCFPVMLDCVEDDIRPDEELYLMPVYYDQTGTRWQCPREKVSVEKENDGNNGPDRRFDWILEKMVVGIVLQRRGGEGARGHFRRVGAFRLCHNTPPFRDGYIRKKYPGKCLEFLEVLQQVGSSTVEAVCGRVDLPESGNPNSRYVITIE